MGKFCWNSTENVSLTKVPPLSMGGKLLQASKLHIWCINSLLNKCRPYITISGSIQPFKMVKIVPENKCPRVPVWVKGGGVRSLFGQCPNKPDLFQTGASLTAIAHEPLSHKIFVSPFNFDLVKCLGLKDRTPGVREHHSCPAAAQLGKCLLYSLGSFKW